MAEANTFPMLHASAHASLKPQAREKSNAQSHRPRLSDPSRELGSNGIAKKKQSKSRNGCITCKTKRLKCDEVKPTCEQCRRRNVVCEGYRKDFKWRPFEEPRYVGRRPSKVSKDPGPSTALSAQPCSNYEENIHDQRHSYVESIPSVDYVPSCSAISGTYDQLPVTSASYAPLAPAGSMYTTPTLSPYIVISQSISPIDAYTPFFSESRSLYGDDSILAERSEATAPSSVAAGYSPRPLDLPLSGADYRVPPEEHPSYCNQHEAIYQFTNYIPSHEPEENDVEEVPRNLDHSLGSWSSRYLSPIAMSKISFSKEPQSHHALAQLQQAVIAPGTSLRASHYDTCGVSYVKDGPTENPWQTLVWPLARDCSALYHAIASMTYFHQSSQFPSMRAHGIDHMRTAVEALEEELQFMCLDAAIATTLILAFAGSWDVQVSTGTTHIKGAGVLIKQALLQDHHVPKQNEERTRLRFLCNSWIYLDVIARLTSTDDGDESDDVDAIYDSIASADYTATRLDPLMDCAHSLFPIIGRVATLIRKIQRTNRGSSDLVAHAMNLRSQLEEWTPPRHVEKFDDETTNPKDSIRIATAFQYATLLYLHQAFPSVPSPSALTLAKRALCELTAVEPSSRYCIIYVYPLMVAGCEMIEEEDRAWVIRSWKLLSSRAKLGVFEKSLAVTKELWVRRDTNAKQCSISDKKCTCVMPPTRSPKRSFDVYSRPKDENGGEDVCWLGSRPKRRAFGSFLQSSVPVDCLSEQKPQEDELAFREDTEVFDPEYMIKGRLHWLGVMEDWNWKALLG